MADLSGQRFGRLTVIEKAGKSKDRHIVWRCRCDCGNEAIVQSNALLLGKTKSCGCLKIDKTKESRTTHGKSDKERLYTVWLGMRQRCNNSHNSDYKYYGAKGVKICEEWNDYGVFREWSLANGYREDADFFDCTIDRINPFGNYEPNNCRWVSIKEQRNNRRSNYVGNDV